MGTDYSKGRAEKIAVIAVTAEIAATDRNGVFNSGDDGNSGDSGDATQ